MRLAIGSVYHENWDWYPIQQRYISRTTKDYELWVCSEVPPVWECDHWVPKKAPDQQSKALESKFDPMSVSHTLGLRALYEKFCQIDCEYCLILDSDAFPVKAGWLSFLSYTMTEFGRGVAAPIRVENGDLFPHPSAFFVRREFLKDFVPRLWALAKMTNLLGKPHFDIGTAISVEEIFPLLKSNKFSPHPLFHNIYYDVFYHCFCGSRKNRAVSLRYWNQIDRHTYKSLPDDELINKLLGENRFLPIL